MKRKALSLLVSSMLITAHAHADTSVQKLVSLISGHKNVDYIVSPTPASSLHAQSVSYSGVLPNNKNYTLEFNLSDIDSVNGTLYLRDTEGNQQGVISIARNGFVQGEVSVVTGDFRLISSGTKLVTMESKPSEKLIEDLEHQFMPKNRAAEGYATLPVELTRQGVTSQSEPSVVRVSLYYTNDVANVYQEAGINPRQAFDFAIAQANQAYANSDIDIKIEIANIEHVDYNEIDSIGVLIDFWLKKGENLNTLDFLFGDEDYMWEFDHFDEELKQSEKYGSDMDMLISHKLEFYCGVARTIGAKERKHSTAITNMQCFEQYTLAHEMGHLFGAEHNWENTAEIPFIAQYAHGYYDAEEWSFRTIMSYRCNNNEINGPKDCPRINYFSTPRKEFNGKYLGTATEHDNARQHNEWAPLVASFSTGADCAQFEPWTTDKAYVKGSEVAYEGNLYQANWWSYNDRPSQTSSKSNWQQVWQLLTNCK
ncbi:hypothetical protein N480_22290 [Pseudoalteromonas luteoviolacea S2607]|uniref:M12 family metallo-peptidase n=1 Tax=Pseudoalteromonas luteoviolacea TaxID=43657 RepID=UPI0007B0BBCA|nr:M12 family metallo-peptidase [Pseudoalteromonas luteoviolacea]KZN34336.1 hypothetical protein N480_22290 [Pseudoalteromonas luteoviolacea S2607]